MISLSEQSMQPEACDTHDSLVKFRVVTSRCSNLREVDLGDFPIVLGRGAEAGIQLRDRWVSRRHCELDLIDGELIVRDLGAKHGTYVNGRLVVEERLRPGDEICIGLTALTIVS